MTQHDAPTGHSAHEGHEVIQETGAGAVRELLTWYRPNFAGLRGLMSWVALGTVIVLAAQALIPWIVELILEQSEEEPVYWLAGRYRYFPLS